MQSGAEEAGDELFNSFIAFYALVKELQELSHSPIESKSTAGKSTLDVTNLNYRLQQLIKNFSNIKDKQGADDLQKMAAIYMGTIKPENLLPKYEVLMTRIQPFLFILAEINRNPTIAIDEYKKLKQVITENDPDIEAESRIMGNAATLSATLKSNRTDSDPSPSPKMRAGLGSFAKAAPSAPLLHDRVIAYRVIGSLVLQIMERDDVDLGEKTIGLEIIDRRTGKKIPGMGLSFENEANARPLSDELKGGVSDQLIHDFFVARGGESNTNIARLIRERVPALRSVSPFTPSQSGLFAEMNRAQLTHFIVEKKPTFELSIGTLKFEIIEKEDSCFLLVKDDNKVKEQIVLDSVEAGKEAAELLRVDSTLEGLYKLFSKEPGHQYAAIANMIKNQINPQAAPARPS